MTSYQELVVVLATGNTVIICCDASSIPTDGCAFQTISTLCEVYMMLKGVVDFGKEVEKLNEKKKKLESQLNFLEKTMAKGDYKEKVPENIQILNDEKVTELNKEIRQISEALGKVLQML